MLGKTKNPGGQSAPQKNKYLVIALLCLPFVLCLYLIFGGSGEQKVQCFSNYIVYQSKFIWAFCIISLTNICDII